MDFSQKFYIRDMGSRISGTCCDFLQIDAGENLWCDNYNEIIGRSSQIGDSSYKQVNDCAFKKNKNFCPLKEKVERAAAERERKEREEREERERKERERQEWLASPEGQRHQYDEALSRLNKAKEKMPNMKTANDCSKLATEFSSIEQIFYSLPSSFNVKAQIEECENCRKQCEEKRQEKQRHEDKIEKIKKIPWIILRFFIGIIIGGILAVILGVIFGSIVRSTWTLLGICIIGMIIGIIIAMRYGR